MNMISVITDKLNKASEKFPYILKKKCDMTLTLTDKINPNKPPLTDICVKFDGEIPIVKIMAVTASLFGVALCVSLIRSIIRAVACGNR